MTSRPTNEPETTNRSLSIDIGASLLKIVSTVMDRKAEELTLTDDLLTIGASSLKIVHILTLMEAEFHVELTLIEVFEALNLGAIAELIAQRYAEAGRGK